MDSTMVHQIGDMAIKLGVEARTALVWWFLCRFAIHMLWAGVVSVVAWRADSDCSAASAVASSCSASQATRASSVRAMTSSSAPAGRSSRSSPPRTNAEHPQRD